MSEPGAGTGERGESTPAVDSYTPPIDELTRPWWEATRQRRLLLQQCRSCAAVQWYPRPICAACGRIDGLGWADATGDGTVDTFSVVHRAPRPGLATPYVIARVRLAEGPLMLSRIVGTDPDAVRCGMELRVAWQQLPDGRALPVFTPRAGGSRPDGRDGEDRSDDDGF